MVRKSIKNISWPDTIQPIEGFDDEEEIDLLIKETLKDHWDDDGYLYED